MKVEITTTIEVDSVYQADEIAKIFKVLIDKGALIGVRGGHTKIHFDAVGKFKGISFDYKPYWVKEGIDKE
jgi:hypothetical protein